MERPSGWADWVMARTSWSGCRQAASPPGRAQPGALGRLPSIDAAGEATGTANTINTEGCVRHSATLTGRVEGRAIRLTITRARHESSPTDLTLTRKPASASA